MSTETAAKENRESSAGFVGAVTAPVASCRAAGPRLLPVRLVAADAPPTDAPAAAGKLVTAGGPATSIEVVLGNGRVLRVGAAADVAAVARLAAALEA